MRSALRVWLVLATCISGTCIFAVRADAASPDPLSFVTNKTSVPLNGVRGEAVAHVLITNAPDPKSSGPTNATVSASLDNGGPVTVRKVSGGAGDQRSESCPGSPDGAAFVTLPPGATPLAITLGVNDSRAAVGRLVLFDCLTRQAVVAEFDPSRSPTAGDVAVTVGIAFALALLLVVGCYRTTGGKWSTPLAEASDWKYKDSWASNVGAIGGAAVVVLGTSGGLSAAIPGVSFTTFVACNLVFLGIIAGAPVVFAAITTLDEPLKSGAANAANGGGDPTRIAAPAGTVGTKGGFAVAAFLTIAGALGELAIVGLLSVMGGFAWPGQLAVIGALAIGAAIVAIYTWATLRSGFTHGRSYLKKGPDAQRVVETLVRAPQPESKIGLRVALL